MEKKKSINKVIKIIGNVVMIIAIIFIAKGLINYDIDYSVITNGNNFIIFLMLICAYTVGVIFTSVPWKNVVYLITGEKIDFFEIATVSTKANVMKYIPGNVFQYVGRNGLAVEKGLKHSDVAVSTLIDVIINLATAFLLTVIFAFDVLIYWCKNKIRPLYLCLLIITGIICLSTIIWYLIKKKAKYKEVLQRVFSKEGVKTVAINIIVYTILSLYNTVISIIVLYIISDGAFGLKSVYVISGAILASWILGFVTPGAPGGMGIRETILIMLVGGLMAEEVILLGVVVNRIVSIIGDVLALIVMQIISKIQRRTIKV